MDFVTLALQQHRFLDEILGEDDDKVIVPSHPTDSTSSATATASSAYNSGFDASTTNVARPLLSKNAEAELLLLATNFLLYVALVIVVILVCYIYFPETLKPKARPVTPRNFNYRVAQTQGNQIEAFHYDDDGEEDSDEHSSTDELLDSSPENEPGTATRNTNFLEFSQESLSRKQVLRRLAFCSIMLNICFVCWGVLQVRSRKVNCLLLMNIIALFLDYNLKHPYLSHQCSPLQSTGKNVDSSLSSLYWRIFYLFIRSCFYKPLLDFDHVRGSSALFQAAPEPKCHHLRIFFSKYIEHALQLVPVRSTSIRVFPSYHTFQIL